MSDITEALLHETGFNELQSERYLSLEAQRRTEECLRMLRCRRCELVEALHEAQRPIDVIDWAIYDLARRVS